MRDHQLEGTVRRRFSDEVARFWNALKLGRFKNRKLTASDIASCGNLISEIDLYDDDTARHNEGEWRTVADETIYGSVCHSGVVANTQYLSHLRFESHIFSGWPLSNLLSEQAAPSWVDALAAEFPATRVSERCDWWIRAFRHYTRNLPQDYICKAPLVAGEIGHKVDGCRVNPDIVAYQERMAILYCSSVLELLKKKPHPVILEIGGGYGALAYFVKAVLSHCTYCIVDLPSSLKFSACYLQLSQQKYPVTIWKNETTNLNRNGFVLIPTTLLSADTISNIDLAINTLSFAEMPSATVETYAKYLASALSPDGVLYEQNFDNGHLDAPTHCSPKPALAKHLKHMATIEGRWLWGEPNLWSSPRS